MILNRKLRQPTHVIFFLTCLVILLNACDQAPVSNKTETAKDSSTAPNFALKSISNSDLSLSKFDNQAVLLNFWSPGCNACESELAFFDQLYLKYQNKNLAVIGINVGGTAQYARNYLEEKNLQLSFPIGTDPVMEISELYGIRSIPATFLLNQQHKIYKKVKAIESEEAFEKLVQSLLN